MDFYRFINSKDIRKYLQDLNYKFNSQEASWLVNQCGDATLEEKHEAWNWIINNMPDMEVRERVNCKYRESLHDTLKKYMAMQDDLLRRFSDPEEMIYSHEYYFNGRHTFYRGSEKLYFSQESSVDQIRQTWDELKEDGIKPGTTIAAARHFRGEEYQILVAYDPDCRIKAVDVRGDCHNDEYDELTYEFFDGFWFDFPTPFKKGDILCKYNDDPDEFEFCRGILVLKSLFPWELKEDGLPNKEKYEKGRSGDISDMTSYGYYLREDGSFYNEGSWNYMDLEYYHGPLTGVKRAYKALSSFMKDEIEIELFTYALREIASEKTQEDFKKHGWFTKEGLELAGLE